MARPIGRRTPASTDELLIHAGPCILHGVYPELTTTGTITFRDAAAIGGSNVRHVCAIGLTQAGKTFGPSGVLFPVGLTVQLSVSTDLSLVSWEPIA